MPVFQGGPVGRGVGCRGEVRLLECCTLSIRAAMASSRRGLLLLLMLLTAHPGPSEAQHWSHGWYPGRQHALGGQDHGVVVSSQEATSGTDTTPDLCVRALVSMRQACLVWTRGHAQGSWRSPHPLDPQASRGGGGASSSGRPGGDWWGQEGRGPGRWQLGGHETSVLRPDRHFSLCRRQPESPAPSRRPPIKCEVLRSCCLEFCPSSPPSLSR